MENPNSGRTFNKPIAQLGGGQSKKKHSSWRAVYCFPLNRLDHTTLTRAMQLCFGSWQQPGLLQNELWSGTRKPGKTLQELAAASDGLTKKVFAHILLGFQEELEGTVPGSPESRGATRSAQPCEGEASSNVSAVLWLPDIVVLAKALTTSSRQCSSSWGGSTGTVVSLDTYGHSAGQQPPCSMFKSTDSRRERTRARVDRELWNHTQNPGRINSSQQ
ncbi:UNVERIFIED_CONTAM: hypothetical protein FKN15_034040 [Acipenser sinensis]